MAWSLFVALLTQRFSRKFFDILQTKEAFSADFLFLRFYQDWPLPFQIQHDISLLPPAPDCFDQFRFFSMFQYILATWDLSQKQSSSSDNVTDKWKLEKATFEKRVSKIAQHKRQCESPPVWVLGDLSRNRQKPKTGNFEMKNLIVN